MIRKLKLKKENGYTLIEVLISLVLIGLISVIFLQSMAISGKSAISSDVRTTAENLAKSQMEFVKYQSFENEVDINGNFLYTKIFLSPSEIADGFTIFSPTDDENNPDYGLNVFGIPWGNQDDLQKIILVVEHRGDFVLMLEGYKLDR